MKTAVIIEDEIDAQQLLARILRDYCPDVKLVGSANNLLSGKNLIESLQPDIVFLDIQLGCETGFQLLDKLSNKSFKLIITTAYQEFALKAFKYEAIDYVLKPYSPNSIVESLGKVHKQLGNSDVYRKLENLLAERQTSTKLKLATSEGYTIVCPENIVHIEADGSYSHMHLISNPKVMISKSLKEVELLLPKSPFFRLHTSHLINMNHLYMYKKEEGGCAVMSNGTQIPVARRRKAEFINKLSKIGQENLQSEL